MMLLVFISLIFNQIPMILRWNFIGGDYSNKLTFYLLFCLLLFSIFEYYKLGLVLKNFSIFNKYIYIYLFIMLLSVCLGIENYPYYQEVLQGPINQIEKIPIIIDFFKRHGIQLQYSLILKIWMSIRVIKTAFLSVIYTFGFSYLLYCWFYKNKEIVYDCLSNAIIYSLIIIFPYSLIEVFYLADSEIAKQILIRITPFFHSLYEAGSWGPPLLWKGQLRSIFPEPSHFGIYTAFAMPFIWYKICKSTKNFFPSFIILIYTFFLFLTQSRTAFVLYIIEIILLIIFKLVFKRIIPLKKITVIILCSFLSFILAISFIDYFNVRLNSQKLSKGIGIKSERQVEKNIEAYVNTNVRSLSSTDKRSNGARYSVAIANIKVGLKHPILGVGNGLTGAYLTDELKGMRIENYEVRWWMGRQKENGILRLGYPNLCEYASRFASGGILGILVYLIPPIILLLSYIKKFKFKIKDITYNDSRDVFFFISFIAMCITGFGDSLDTTYCYWILLPLGYILIIENSNKENSANNERRLKK